MNDESTLDKDSSVHLIYHDPSDLGSLILMRIMPKERTLGFPISHPLRLGRRLVYANTYKEQPIDQRGNENCVELTP